MTNLGKKIKATCVMEDKNVNDLIRTLNMSHQALYARLGDDDRWKLSELVAVAKLLNKDLTFFLANYDGQNANN